MRRSFEITIGIVYGLVCHGGFAIAIGALIAGLYSGMRLGCGTLHGPAAVVANGLLLLQFPLLHSGLLSTRGRRVLVRLAPPGLGMTLAPTTFAIVGAVQIAATFLLWSPTGLDILEPSGAVHALLVGAFAASFVFLMKALLDAGLGLQTGWIGWTALVRGRRPVYPEMPTKGLFQRCRQPIYLGFALVLWTAPTWTVDHLAIAVVWSMYCVLGPLLKEERFLSLYRQEFAAYRQRVPYLVPKFWSHEHRIRRSRSA